MQEKDVPLNSFTMEVLPELSWRPSEYLLPKELRTKYETDMPLEGIPSFITSEMITGALKVQDEYGYPASVTIAQIIQESGYGTSDPEARMEEDFPTWLTSITICSGSRDRYGRISGSAYR